MLILNRRVGESVNIDDWDMTHIITLDHFTVESGRIAKVMVSVKSGAVTSRYIVPLGEFIQLRSDIAFKFDCLQSFATQNGTEGSLKMILDLPPKDSARAVEVVRSELLIKNTG